jgi:hypothetical protein
MESFLERLKDQKYILIKGISYFLIGALLAEFFFPIGAIAPTVNVEFQDWTAIEYLN